MKRLSYYFSGLFVFLLFLSGTVVDAAVQYLQPHRFSLETGINTQGIAFYQNSTEEYSKYIADITDIEEVEEETDDDGGIQAYFTNSPYSRPSYLFRSSFTKVYPKNLFHSDEVPSSSTVKYYLLYCNLKLDA